MTGAAALAETRRQLIYELITEKLDAREVAEGVEFGVRKREIWRERLDRFRGAWPQVDIELVDDSADDGLVWLRITGPPGTREAFRGVLTAGPAAYRRPSRMAWRFRVLTSPLRVRPDFVIIGTSKGGTSALYSYLARHPDVVSASRKETFFFDRHHRPGLSRYRAFFPTFMTRWRRRLVRRPFVTGEASPTYLDHPRAPARLRDAVPAARLIAILRDPAERAHSLYQLKARTDEEKLSFEAALEREDRELDREQARVAADPTYFSSLLHHHAYRSGGIYVDHLQRWMEVFPREQLLVLSSRDLRQQPAATYGRVLEFLGLPPHELPRFDKVNTSPSAKLDPETRARLRAYYRPHNARLWAFLGEDFGWDG